MSEHTVSKLKNDEFVALIKKVTNGEKPVVISTQKQNKDDVNLNNDGQKIGNKVKPK